MLNCRNICGKEASKLQKRPSTNINDFYFHFFLSFVYRLCYNYRIMLNCRNNCGKEASHKKSDSIIAQINPVKIPIQTKIIKIQDIATFNAIFIVLPQNKKAQQRVRRIEHRFAPLGLKYFTDCVLYVILSFLYEILKNPLCRLYQLYRQSQYKNIVFL